LKTLIHTSLFFFLVSTLAIGIAGSFSGFSSNDLPVEVLQEPRTSFADEALRAILETDALRGAVVPQLIVLGASGAQEAYPPPVLQPFLSEWQVNNAAVGAANPGELREVYAHCRKALPSRIAKDSLLVLGLSYPLFVPDEVRWRHPDFVSPDLVASGLYFSDLKRESMRSPLVLDATNPLFKAAPGPLLSIAKCRALFWNGFRRTYTGNPADSVLEWDGWRWRLPKRHAGDRSRFPERVRKPVKGDLTPRQQMDWLTSYMGTEPGVLLPEQFGELIWLIREARATGMAVAVVDMPLPSWHRAGSAFVAPYREKLAAALVEFAGDEEVSFVDLSSSVADDGFRDSIHPSVDARHAWCERLAIALSEARSGTTPRKE
jgi:hypothetical protein